MKYVGNPTFWQYVAFKIFEFIVIYRSINLYLTLNILFFSQDISHHVAPLREATRKKMPWKLIMCERKRKKGNSNGKKETNEERVVRINKTSVTFIYSGMSVLKF